MFINRYKEVTNKEKAMLVDKFTTIINKMYQRMYFT